MFRKARDDRYYYTEEIYGVESKHYLPLYPYKYCNQMIPPGAKHVPYFVHVKRNAHFTAERDYWQWLRAPTVDPPIPRLAPHWCRRP